MTAATLDTTPDRKYSSATRRCTGIPAYRAPPGLKPTTYNVRPIAERCSSIQ